MSGELDARAQWCIVVADDHGPGREAGLALDPGPVQYCRIGAGTTPLEKALHRAAEFAPPSQVMLTVCEEYRHLWEAAAWSVPADSRFVCDDRTGSRLNSAAAILSVAASSPSNIIIMLPARCFAVHEWMLRRAIKHALLELPGIPEGVLTLGMLDPHESADEDYLIVSRPPFGRGLAVDGYARRPVSRVARHLRHRGALVASGIMIGYAGVFAAHVSKHWPGIAKKLEQLISTAASVGVECEIPGSLSRGASPATLGSLRWQPPAFPQRVLGVCRSGWSGLRSRRSVAELVKSLSSRAALERLDREMIADLN